ncbi:MAG: hypothetical protein A3B10_03730 [Candidatus Doudnabacteria bacterium RIFCSPLOWO2_01_FULL_44_21]|uniref:protein-tyrosine-phosphatase n=1 Tax=Candidatus Doudnabacteria bacterium RIFCSPLOWO2_01_FULL_44_21 TaxID=1817841 RepID=A0A1F5PY53_9BACT|nr:MAG: hypothetical protein A3B95_02115 [Candidatus Doudnabacteria bacterium RIFCSPHIGHO2_02_FULL_43_13b]OGE94871.1 MAG: hypothetical protein A3B10_03730 [Candidatus Doudnabacteria bacterium RIFCSPLOWO2_01_FULL_44_21]
MGSKLILVVCNGNVHRSVVAQLCITRELQRRSIDGIACVSRGLQGTAGTALPQGRNLRDYPREWSLTKPVLDRLGIEIPVTQQSMPVDRAVVEQARVIFAMDSGVLLQRSNSLVNQFSDQRHKMRLLGELTRRHQDIPDCFGSDSADLHEVVNHSIHRIIEKGFDELLHWVSCDTKQESSLDLVHFYRDWP